MKVAIAKDGDFVSEHFGHCKEYALFVIENSRITSRENLVSPGHEPGNYRHCLPDIKLRTSLQAEWGQKQWTCSALIISRYSLEYAVK